MDDQLNTATIVQKLWNYCNVLRDDGMSYGDYVERLTYLALFEEGRRAQPAALYNQPSPVLLGYDWESLRWRDGDWLFDCTANLGVATQSCGPPSYGSDHS
ncbi:MAG: hypothetical protein ACYCSH_06420 [Acidithiobacillus sp.]